MNLDIVVLNEEDQTKTTIIWYRLYAESKNKWTYSQNRNRVTDIENQNKQPNLWLPGVKGEGINWETGTDIHTQLYIKWKTNKDLLYSTGNSTQYSIMTYMGKQ